jgi:hypothetical protein
MLTWVGLSGVQPTAFGWVILSLWYCVCAAGLVLCFRFCLRDMRERNRLKTARVIFILLAVFAPCLGGLLFRMIDRQRHPPMPYAN